MTMLDSLKQTGKNIGRGIDRAWEDLSEGWRELLSRSSDALTQLTHHKDDEKEESSALATFPRWSLLAGELEETATDVVVRLGSRHLSLTMGILARSCYGHHRH